MEGMGKPSKVPRPDGRRQHEIHALRSGSTTRHSKARCRSKNAPLRTADSRPSKNGGLEQCIQNCEHVAGVRQDPVRCGVVIPSAIALLT
jgi:hypothetical protein